MLLFIYSQLVRLALPLILIRLWWRGRQAPARRKDWRHRLGYVPRMTGRVVWVHAVSVGETIAAGPLVSQLLARDPHTRILMTAMTDTGQAQARKMFGDQVSYAYAPYDTPGALHRFLKRVKPAVLVIMETEIWPNMIVQCHRRNVPAILVNARLSERSARGYEKVRALVTPVMESLTWIAAQAESDASRFRRIGVSASRVEVTGSVKFDVEISAATRSAASELRASLGERPVWIAGSTHQGEDAILLAAHRQLLAQYPSALLILVPRHPERFDAVAELSCAEGFTVARRSREACSEKTEVYLGDAMGELMMLYGAADVAFVGGSLVERGGHNPLEPAAWGRPVLSGTNVFNFETIYEQFRAGDGVCFVQDEDELARTLAQLFSDTSQAEALGRRAQEVVSRNRGALERVVDGIARHL